VTGYAYQLRCKHAPVGVVDLYVRAPTVLPRIGDGILFEDGLPPELEGFPAHLWVEAVEHPIVVDRGPRELIAQMPLVVATSHIVRVGERG
jgi:hypothetical protein